MLTIATIIASVFGTVVGAFALVNTLHHLKNLVGRLTHLRMPPGYELSGKMMYVTGPRDIDPAFLGGEDPQFLTYHEKGLPVFSRDWTRRLWFNGITISIVGLLVYGLVASLTLYFSVPYLLTKMW